MNNQSMKKNELLVHIKDLEAKLLNASSTMTVTSCKVYPFRDVGSVGKIKAIASIILNDTLQVRGLRVMDGANGFYVGYPIDPFYKGDEFSGICFPITRAMREHIENVVLNTYQQTISTEVA